MKLKLKPNFTTSIKFVLSKELSPVKIVCTKKQKAKWKTKLNTC